MSPQEFATSISENMAKLNRCVDVPPALVGDNHFRNLEKATSILELKKKSEVKTRTPLEKFQSSMLYRFGPVLGKKEKQKLPQYLHAFKEDPENHLFLTKSSTYRYLDKLPPESKLPTLDIEIPYVYELRTNVLFDTLLLSAIPTDVYEQASARLERQKPINLLEWTKDPYYQNFLYLGNVEFLIKELGKRAREQFPITMNGVIEKIKGGLT